MPPPIELPLDLDRWDAVIFDLDGTLVHTLGDFVAALHRTLDELDLSRLTPQQVAHSVGKGSEHLVRRALQLARGAQAVDEALYDCAIRCYMRHYEDVNGQHSQLFHGVRTALDTLHKSGVKLGCVTNKPGAFARDLLQAFGLAGYFELVYGGDEFERKKPDPLPLLRACEALDSVPQRTLVVGDSCNDAQAARAAGCSVLLMSYGYNHGEPVQAVEADGVLDSMLLLLPTDAVSLG